MIKFVSVRRLYLHLKLSVFTRISTHVHFLLSFFLHSNAYHRVFEIGHVLVLGITVEPANSITITHCICSDLSKGLHVHSFYGVCVIRSSANRYWSFARAVYALVCKHYACRFGPRRWSIEVIDILEVRYLIRDKLATSPFADVVFVVSIKYLNYLLFPVIENSVDIKVKRFTVRSIRNEITHTLKTAPGSYITSCFLGLVLLILRVLICNFGCLYIELLFFQLPSMEFLLALILFFSEL